MPVIRKENATVVIRGEDQAHHLLRFSDDGKLTQFGAFLHTMAPGGVSSIKHWHANEDEFVYMLEGEVVVHEGEEETILRPGDAACFPAGAPKGHNLENRSDAAARMLVVGTRSGADTVTYPDADRILKYDDAADTVEWTDHAGAPASNPYLD